LTPNTDCSTLRRIESQKDYSMHRTATYALALSLPLGLLSQAALADLTPQQVWSDWRQYMEDMGYAVQATEDTSGPEVRISDLSLNMTLPEDEGVVSISLGDLSFEQNEDGSVSVVMPASMPISINGISTDDDGENFTMNLSFSQTGQDMIVSGTAEEMTYDYDAATFALSLNELIVGNESYAEDNARINVVGSGLSTTTTMTAGDMRGYAQTGEVATVTYDIFVDNPDETSQLALSGNIEDLRSEGSGDLPAGLSNSADMAAMLRAGLDVAGVVSYAGGNSKIAVTDPVEGNFTIETATSGGEFGVEMGQDGIAYDLGQSNLQMILNIAELPFPIQFGLDALDFSLAAPALSGEEPQDFSLGLALQNFTMSDMIWGIFDPTGQLPRDPATLEIDIEGEAKVDVDYFDPQAATQIGPEGPGELRALTINSLLVDAAGAKLEGAGDITFDNTDTQTIPGMPRPTGEVNLALVGGNALIEKLVAMGILPSEQAMGARMMLGLFAVPGAQPDTLTSKIEFTEEGAILANGQRVR
jgi:hypothetical protein